MKKSKIFESTEEMMARYEMANSEANEELIAEIHILKDSVKEINDKENFIKFTPNLTRISSKFDLIIFIIFLKISCEIKKINTNQPVLNNHTLAEFLENPTKVIEESPSYRSMATYAEEKKIELDQLKKQMGDYELEQCEIQDKIYFLKTSKTGSTSIANILTRFGIRNGIRI